VDDHFRSAEVPWIGGECEAQDGLHVFADCRRIEIVDEDGASVGPDVEGDVIASDLTNRVFPILRYRLGDISSLRSGRCTCGRALPRLGAISGRRSDTIRLPDGTTIAGALGHIFDDHPLAVHQFEIEQAADYSVTLTYVPGRDPEVGVRGAERKLRQALRGLVPLTVRRTDEIVQTGGKMRFIRSDAPASPESS
jgi:phenylacetate-CoA ligase